MALSTGGKTIQKAASKTQVSGLKLVQTSYWGCGWALGAHGVFSVLRSLQLLCVSAGCQAHCGSPAILCGCGTTDPWAYSPALLLAFKDRPSEI